MSNRMKLGTGLALVAAAVILFIVLRAGDEDSDRPAERATSPSKQDTSKQAGGQTRPEPPPIQVVRVRGGRPVGGVQRIEVTSGERARFEVRSDSAGEVHVHGYDLTKQVGAGGTAKFDFPANLEGGYELEIHGAAGEFQIADLVVSPG